MKLATQSVKNLKTLKFGLFVFKSPKT